MSSKLMLMYSLQEIVLVVNFRQRETQRNDRIAFVCLFRFGLFLVFERVHCGGRFLSHSKMMDVNGFRCKEINKLR